MVKWFSKSSFVPEPEEGCEFNGYHVDNDGTIRIYPNGQAGPWYGGTPQAAAPSNIVLHCGIIIHEYNPCLVVAPQFKTYLLKKILNTDDFLKQIFKSTKHLTNKNGAIMTFYR